jgi:YegS/Rv2252/BmrU family lipid kinase
VTTVAVVARADKRARELPELRTELEREGVTEPLWYEVTKGKQVRKCARKALDEGADLVFVWGGDGAVQRCADALAGRGATMAIVPAGTANLLATNLGIPKNIAKAVRIGLHGARRAIDTGVINGERFAVMAGAGWDARMIRDADGTLKQRLGRLAYIWTGAKNLRSQRVPAKVRIDGKPWFEGRLSMILVGNVGKIFGGVQVFEDARPDDGSLAVGVVTAESVTEWARALARTALGDPSHSPFVETTTAQKISVRLWEPLLYELDGGDRKPTDRLKIRVEPGSLEVCVPEA